MKISIDQMEECIMDNHRLNTDHLTGNTQRARKTEIITRHEAHSQYKVEMHIMVVSNFQALEMKLEVRALTITML